MFFKKHRSGNKDPKCISLDMPPLSLISLLLLGEGQPEGLGGELGGKS